MWELTKIILQRNWEKGWMGQMIMANQYTTTTNKQCILTNTKQKILCTMPMIKTKTLQIICVIRKKASLGI